MTAGAMTLLLRRLAVSRQLARRSIFTLPDLSSFSPFSDNNQHDPQTYHERKILPYSPSELYAVVADVPLYPEFLPFCTAARILSRTPPPPRSAEPERMEAEMTVGFLSFKESYISQVLCRPNESVEVVAASSTPLFKALNTVWRFQPASPQSPHPSNQSLPGQQQPFRSALKGEQAEGGPTLVTLDLSFSFANPVHAAVSATFFGQVSGMMVKAFEERCLEIYGPGKK